MFLLVAYDVENDRNRVKIAEELLNAGLSRVQKSVFEGEISKADLLKLKARLKKLTVRKDNIRYYALCQKCRAKTEAAGRKRRAEKRTALL